MGKHKILENKRPALWIAGIYVLLGGLWILFSDQLAIYLFEDPVLITRVQTYKGWVYVIASGFLIYFLMNRAVSDLNRARYNLQEKELMQKDFLNRHVQPLWQTDHKGSCIFTNKKWFEFTGAITEEKKTFGWMDRIHPDDKAYCIDKFTFGLIHQKAFNIEYRILTRDNKYHWVFNSCMPDYDSAGVFRGFTGFIFDIQEKKELEERHKQSSKRYGYLFSNNPHPMLVYNTYNLQIMEVNKASVYLYGYSQEELLSMRITDLRPMLEVPVLLEHIANELPAFHRSSGWIHKKKNGELFDVEVTSHQLPSQGSYKTRLVIIRDISQQIQAFRAAKEGERRFNAIFEHSPFGVLILCDRLEIQNLNTTACHMLALDAEKAKSMPLTKLIPRDLEKSFLQDIQKITQENPIIGEAHMVDSLGKLFRVEFTGIGFIEQGKRIIYFSFHDIDKKYETQKALRESERINATLLSNLPGMAYRCKNDSSWTMLLVSSGVERLTGYKGDDLLHSKEQSYEQLIHPDDRNMVRNVVSRALKQKKNYEVQYRIATKDGEKKWVWEQARGIEDSQGEINIIEGFIMDITREKKAAQQVEFQTYFLSLIINNIPFPLFYKNTQGEYEGCNQAFCEYLNLPREKIVGRTVYDIFAPEQAQVFYQKDKDLLDAGTSQIYETEIQFPDGRLMHAVFHKSVFRNMENEPMGIIGVYFDITQRVEAEKVIKKQLDELSRVNSELERFTYTVSHDLRSPLVTIKGFLGLLKEDLKDQNQQQVDEDIFRIENATDKMQQLLEDLLKLSRLDRAVDHNEMFSMTVVAKEAQELLFGILSDKKVTIRIQDDMPSVCGSKARIREIFQNLIENAIKFTHKSPSPTVLIYARKENNDYVFCVEDNGPGIPAKYHQKIFGLFNKLQGSSPGTGIGLTLVKRIIDNHQGRIWVEKGPTLGGAAFCFTLNTEKSNTENP